MSAADAVAVAVIFSWPGMVVAISFIEAPLKFQAPDVSLQIGLGIGRLVFRALRIRGAPIGGQPANLPIAYVGSDGLRIVLVWLQSQCHF